MTTDSQESTSPPAEPAPRGVQLGVGGSPLAIGLIFFGIAALALGMVLVGRPTGSQGAILPILILGSGLYQLMTTLWAIFLGQSLVAAIFSTFSAFWLTFSTLVLGLTHGWFGIADADVAGAQEVFFIAWAVLFLLLTIPCLALPAIYPLAVFLVFVACSLAACSVFYDSGNLSTAAGASALTFSFLAFYSWVRVALEGVGVKRLPPIGPVILR